MPIQSRLQFLNSVDGAHVINPFCWIKDVLHILNPDGEFVISDDFYTTGGARKEVYIKLGRHHPLRLPENPQNPRDNVAQFTIIGRITDIGTNFDVLGAQAVSTPVESFKIPNITWTLGLEVIDPNDLELLGIHQDQVYSCKDFGLLLETHNGGIKKLRRPISGKGPEGNIMLNFPPHFTLGPLAAIVPSPRKRNNTSSSTTTVSTTVPPNYSPSSPGPAGSLYPTSQLPGFDPSSIPSTRLRLRQAAVYGSDGSIIHPASFKSVFTTGEIVRTIVEINALSLDSGLYGSMHIIEMHHVKVNLKDKTPLPDIESPIDEFDDSSKDELEDDSEGEGKSKRNEGEVLVPGTPDPEDNIFEDISSNKKNPSELANSSGLVPKMEKDTPKCTSAVEEFALISGAVSMMESEGPTTSKTSSKTVKRKAGAQGGKKGKKVKSD